MKNIIFTLVVLIFFMSIAFAEYLANREQGEKSDALEKEAVEKAISVKYKNVDVKILRPEYLVAIFLKVFRPKDRDKLIKLLDQVKIDKNLLHDVLSRHNLDQKFDDFMEKYYG